MPVEDGQMTVTEGLPSGSARRRKAVLTACAQVLGADDRVAGAGFLVGEDIAVTCAHVVRAARQGPGGQVRLAFPHLPGEPRVSGHVLADQWRAPEAEDIAFVRLERVPAGAVALELGSAAGRQGVGVSSFGFSAQAPPGGHRGYAKAGDLLPDSSAGMLLQLSEANDLTTGFSGGPVVDDVTGLVIAMVTSITSPDPHLRGQNIAYSTPSDTLREVRPELVVHELCPYLGLAPFTAEHTEWFHGRTAAVDSVLAALRDHPRMLLLLGPSGAGKSSLVNAGVLPALARGEIPGSDRWLPVLARPGQDLLAELEKAGLPGATTDGILPAVERRLASEPGCDRLLLVLDQFEELLTQQPTPAAGAQGSDRRLTAAGQLVELVESYAAVSVIVIMRNDFYAPLAALAPDLMDADLSGLLNVPGTLSGPELEEIITGPAEAVGIPIEDDLAKRIVEDVLKVADPTTQRAPVTLLPPLELALSRLCKPLDEGRLTHRSYLKIGEVTGALANWCDEAMGKLSTAHRPTARRFLTALVRPADADNGIPATRQRVSLTRLRSLAAASGPGEPPPGEAFDAVLSALTHHRIITVDTATQPDGGSGEPTAELIHDALIRDWSRLRHWVDQDKQFHTWLHRATEQGARHSRKKLPGDLLDGSLLAEGVEWSRERSLPEDITALLTSSQQHQNAALRRTRRFNAVLAGVLALALIAAGVAFLSRQDAITAQREAESRQLAAESRQIAADSTNLLSTDPDLASLLAVRAYRMSPTDEATAALYYAADLPLRHVLGSPDDRFSPLAFSPDSKTLAISNSGRTTIRLLDSASGKSRDTLDGPFGASTAMAFSSDGKTLASIGTDRILRRWEVVSGRSRPVPGPSPQFAASATFSPDGKTLATAPSSSHPSSTGEDVQLWDTASGEVRATLKENSDSVSSAAFSPDGKTLATVLQPDEPADDATVQLWDVASDKFRAKGKPLPAAWSPIAFSPDGKTLATGGVPYAVQLWDIASGKRRGTVEGYSDIVESMAFSPDGKTLATGSSDGSVWLLDVASGKFRAVLKGHTSQVKLVMFSPDGKTLATETDAGEVRLWNMAARESRHVLHSDWELDSVVFSPDGRTLATGREDRTDGLWDVASGKKSRYTFDDPLDYYAYDWSSVVFSPDSKTVATGKMYKFARLWDAASGKFLYRPDGLSMLFMVFSPDGKTLVIGEQDGTVRLWDMASRKTRTTFKGYSLYVNWVAFSPDGKLFAMAGGPDGNVRLWDAASGKSRFTLKEAEGQALAFNPDSKTLASGELDGTVQLWDVASGKSRYLLKDPLGLNTMTFSPDGKILAIAGGTDGTVRLYDATSGKSRTTLRGHTGEVDAVAFSPDGKTLATGSTDTTARLWDVASGNARAVLTGHTGAVKAVAFSPDGKTLATGSDDKTARPWDVALPDADQIARNLCQIIHRNFTKDEQSMYLHSQASDPVCPDSAAR